MTFRLACRGALFAAIALAAPASADDPTFCRITLDGFFSDWEDMPVAHADPAADHGNQTIDLQSIWLANDDEWLYLRVETGGLISFQNSSLRIYIDTDNNPATGYTIGAIGSDLALLMPERRWVEQLPGQFEAAGTSASGRWITSRPNGRGTNPICGSTRSASVSPSPPPPWLRSGRRL